MQTKSIVIFICIFSIGIGVRCDLIETVKQQIFNFCFGIALVYKDVTGTNVTKDNVTFILYNNANTNGIVINSNNLELVSSTPGIIFFIIHGASGNGTKPWVIAMKNAFLTKAPDSSVIVVDWSGPAAQEYPIAAVNTLDVGNFIGEMVVDLVDNHNVDIAKIRLMGHSLGAHVCGFAGKKVKSLGKLMLPRIFAMDPAGPCFYLRPREERLNSDDATYVKVLHTNGGFYGFKLPCGTIDYYANGGSKQPGCAEINLTDIAATLHQVSCDHSRSFVYLIEAILNPTYFVATQCTNYGTIFQKCDENSKVGLREFNSTMKGTFYFNTNAHCPFAKESQAGEECSEFEKTVK